MHFLDLPNDFLIEMLECLSYDEVAKKRLVCRRFDEIAQQVLNGGFHKAIKQHNINFKRIKALLPRRESERRNHCLARHADILTSVETRISMLSMTYVKFMDVNLCCFIPGRVLDEIFRILRLTAKTNKPLRPHEVLQELRDISSMAIEHFDEKIAISLKKTFNNSSRLYGSCGNSADAGRLTATSVLGSISFSGIGPSTPTMKNTPMQISLCGKCFIGGNSRSYLKTTASGSESLQSILPSTSNSISEHQHSVEGCPEARATMTHFKKLEVEYNKGIAKMNRMQQDQNEQSKKLEQTLNSVADLTSQIVELKKRLEDVDAKNRELSANIRHISGGEPTKTGNIENTTNVESKSNVDSEVLSLCPPSTSSSVDKNLNKNLRKRHNDATVNVTTNEEKDITELEDNSERKVKNPKLQL